MQLFLWGLLGILMGVVLIGTITLVSHSLTVSLSHWFIDTIVQDYLRSQGRKYRD